MKPKIATKRIYDPAVADDGLRVLVDRLWPRGLSRRVAAVDVWARDLAPTPALRHRFYRDPQRWAEFRSSYRTELKRHVDELDALMARSQGGRLTLLFGASDTEHNNAVVLKEALEQRPR